MPELIPAKLSTQKRRDGSLAKRSIARQKALAGDPFDLIRYEWPNLIIRDPVEKALFEKYCVRDKHLDLRIDDFQYDLIKSVFDGLHTQAFMGGGTGLGKGFIVGGIICNIWFSIYSEETNYSKVVLVGPTEEHLIKNMYADCSKWRKMMTSHNNDCEFVDDPQVKGFKDKNNPEHWLALANTSSGEAISGAHSPNTLYVFEEGSAIPDNYYTNALSQTKFLIAVSNPRLPGGWFYDGYPKDFVNGIETIKSTAGPRRIYAIGAVDCLNVRARRLSRPLGPVCGIDIEGVHFGNGDPIPLEMKPLIDPLIPGQTCFDRCESLKLTRTKDEVEWAVYGRFPRSNDLLMLFKADWKAPSIARYIQVKEKIKPRAGGLDVGGSKNGDPSCLAMGDHQGVMPLTLFQEKNTALLKGLVYATFRQKGVTLQNGTVPLAVDTNGIGQMLGFQMQMEGCNIIFVENQGAAEHNKEEYVNRRAEVYGEVADSINPACYDPVWGIVDDPMLWEELYVLEKIFQGNGQRYILIPKRRPPSQKEGKIVDNRMSVEEKLKRSPDRGDAVSLLRQAVLTLPECVFETAEQFNPSKKLKEYVKMMDGDYHVIYWNGKTVDMPREEFVRLFGSEQPIPFGSKKF